MSDTEPMVYIARKTCGCVVAAQVDTPEYSRAVAKEIGNWVRDGYTVERMTVATVRVSLARCPHEPARKPTQATQEALL